MGVFAFFVLQGPDYKSAMLIYFIRSYNTVRSFESIFMKFTRLVGVHSWMNPIVFGNNRSSRTTDMGKMCPRNQFFGFKSDDIGFFEKKT